MPRSLVEARHETSRKEIVAAARRLFAERGVRATSLAAIAAELGINKATLYYYYPAKNDIVVDTVREYAADYLADILRPLPDGLSAPDAIWMRFDYKLDRWERTGPLDNKFFYTVMLEELGVPEVEAAYEWFWASARAEVRELVHRGQAEGAFRTDLDVDAHIDASLAAILGIDIRGAGTTESPRPAYRAAIEQFLAVLAS
jgi:AcrR family transcriptional regulator